MWINVQFDVDDVITVTKTVEIMKNKDHVEFDFNYTGLQKKIVSSMKA